MQFSSQTEYSVRVLLYLACQQHKSSQPATINTLSEALGINRNYLPKILKPLRDHKMLRSEAGIRGGFSLAVDPKTTSLLDILFVTEGTIKLNPCLDNSESCNLHRNSICPVQKAYQDFQKMFEEYFDNISLEDLAKQEMVTQQSQIYQRNNCSV